MYWILILGYTGNRIITLKGDTIPGLESRLKEYQIEILPEVYSEWIVKIKKSKRVEILETFKNVSEGCIEGCGSCMITLICASMGGVLYGLLGGLIGNIVGHPDEGYGIGCLVGFLYVLGAMAEGVGKEIDTIKRTKMKIYKDTLFIVTFVPQFSQKEVIRINKIIKNYQNLPKLIWQTINENIPEPPAIAYIKSSAEVENLAGKVITRLPKGMEVKLIEKKWGKYYVETPAGIEGWVSEDKIVFREPDRMKPFVKILEKKLKGPILYIKGAVYDDKLIAYVSLAGKTIPRASFAVEKSNYGDVYPFEVKYVVAPGEKLCLKICDGVGNVVELPIGIETPKVEYIPKYAVLVTNRKANIRSAPSLLSKKLSVLPKGQQIVAIGYKKDWYYLASGGWIHKSVVEEIATKIEEIETITIKKTSPTLTSDVDKNIPVKPVKNPDAVAVIIGVRDYEKEDVPPVKYALNDARTVKEYLVKVLGFKEENIIYEENPTKGDLERIFGTSENPEGELHRWVKPGKSDVFIYYAGHGAPDISSRKAYFVPSDCHPNYVKLNGYPLDVFYRNLSKIPARRIIVVIDACFSGLSEGGMLIASASPLIPVVVKNVAPQNAVIFTASKGDEVASWYDEQGHSLFTYYFLKGLRGEADLNKDGKLTCGELYDYVKENVSYYARRYLGRNQTPTFTGNEIMRLW